jgi:hypothetical protein
MDICINNPWFEYGLVKIEWLSVPDQEYSSTRMLYRRVCVRMFTRILVPVVGKTIFTGSTCTATGKLSTALVYLS